MNDRGQQPFIHGNSFANGPTGMMKLLGWDYFHAKSLSTTIYDLGA